MGRNTLIKTSYMYKDRVKHMEDIGVKVALGATAMGAIIFSP